VGVAWVIYALAARRYGQALAALVLSVLVGSLAATGWHALLRSPPERELAIDFRKDVSSGWMAATFPNCRPAPLSSGVTCDSNVSINKVQLTLPDGAELWTIAKYMTLTLSPDARHITSANLVLHPYMAAADTVSLTLSVKSQLATGSRDASAATQKARDVEIWLRQWQSSSEVDLPKRTDHYLCIDRDVYKFCVRYRHSSFGQGFTVTYEVTVKN